MVKLQKVHDSQFTITVPIDVVNFLKWKPGEELEFVRIDENVVIRKVDKGFKKKC